MIMIIIIITRYWQKRLALRNLPKWSKKAHAITLVWRWDELRPTKNASSSTWGDPKTGLAQECRICADPR